MAVIFLGGGVSIQIFEKLSQGLHCLKPHNPKSPDLYFLRLGAMPIIKGTPTTFETTELVGRGFALLPKII